LPIPSPARRIPPGSRELGAHLPLPGWYQDGSGEALTGGAGQVAGRLFYLALAAHSSVRGRALVVMAAGAVTIATLAALPGPAALLIAMAILVGPVCGPRLPMVRRMSTVRFRKGAPGHGHLSNLEPSSSLPMSGN
jgi:hypothetical protein